MQIVLKVSNQSLLFKLCLLIISLFSSRFIFFLYSSHLIQYNLTDLSLILLQALI